MALQPSGDEFDSHKIPGALAQAIHLSGGLRAGERCADQQLPRDLWAQPVRGGEAVDESAELGRMVRGEMTDVTVRQPKRGTR